MLVPGTSTSVLLRGTHALIGMSSVACVGSQDMFSPLRLVRLGMLYRYRATTLPGHGIIVAKDIPRNNE